MWVTQTYLGDVERDAKFYVYFLYEDYVPDQANLTQAIQHELENLGEVYGDSVSLMMPNPRFAGRIEAEVRDFPKLWMAVKPYLPGLLMSPVPLTELQSSISGCNFIPLKNGSAKHLASVVQSVRNLADDAIATHAGASDEPKPKFLERVSDAIEVKPGIWGVKIDLRKVTGI